MEYGVLRMLGPGTKPWMYQTGQEDSFLIWGLAKVVQTQPEGLWMAAMAAARRRPWWFVRRFVLMSYTNLSTQSPDEKKTKNNKRVSFEIYRSMRLSMRAVKGKLVATMEKLSETLTYNDILLLTVNKICEG